MKTKDKVKKSLASVDVAFQRLRCAQGAVDAAPASPFGTPQGPRIVIYSALEWCG